MNASQYNSKLINCRYLTNRVLSIADQRLVSVLEGAYKEIENILKLKSSDTLTYKVYANRQKELLRVINSISTGVNTIGRLGIRKTAEEVTSVYKNLGRDYAARTGFDFNWGAAFNTVPTSVIRTVTGRVWMDGRNFSDRVWRIDDLANRGVNKIVTSGIARGESAVNMSKRLQQFLLNKEITSGTSWTTGVEPSVTGRGTIHYNALRLARTEINNAYRETLVQSNEANPVVLGVRWNLSASHPVPDVCDLWAVQDLYGLGAGVYPAGRTPVDHPGGLCFLTDELRPASQWNEPKPDPDVSMPSKEDAVSTLGTISDAQKNAAWKTFENVNKMLESKRFQFSKAA